MSKKFENEQEAIQAIQQNSASLNDIPEELRSFDVCLAADIHITAYANVAVYLFCWYTAHIVYCIKFWLSCAIASPCSFSPNT